MALRDTYTYIFYVGRRISHRGITNDPDRREREHQRLYPDGRLVVVGRAKTYEGAVNWEKQQRRTIGYHHDK